MLAYYKNNNNNNLFKGVLRKNIVLSEQGTSS